MPRRPTIGICGPDRGGLPAWVFTSCAIRLTGGRPLRITPKRGLPQRDLDGLILGGGADIDPGLYGDHETSFIDELRRPKGRRQRWLSLLAAPVVHTIRWVFSSKRASRLDAGRDALEREVLSKALDRNLPVLGICRGAQLLNVCLGGTLHRELSSFYVEAPNPYTVLPRKYVILEPGSHLQAALATGSAFVNSLHRQAVDLVATELRSSARERNGVIQAVEHESRDFCIGVQWHPEYLLHRREQRRLFRALVEAARQRQQNVASFPSAPPPER